MSSSRFSEADNASVRAVMSKAVGRMSRQGNIAGSHPQPYFSFSGPTASFLVLFFFFFLINLFVLFAPRYADLNGWKILGFFISWLPFQLSRS